MKHGSVLRLIVMPQALRVANHGYVLETGYVVKKGTGHDLLEDPAVRAAYLGG